MNTDGNPSCWVHSYSTTTVHKWLLTVTSFTATSYWSLHMNKQLREVDPSAAVLVHTNAAVVGLAAEVLFMTRTVDPTINSSLQVRERKNKKKGEKECKGMRQK